MNNGIRKVRLERESKRRGRDVFAYKVPYRDANGKQTSETFTTLEDAKNFKASLRVKRYEGGAVDPKAGHVSVRDYGERWLETKHATKRPRTAAAYATHLRNHIFPTLAGKHLRAVTRADVQALVNTLAASSLSARTVALVYKTVAAMFRTAVVDGTLAASPCLAIELPEVPSGDAYPLGSDQVRALAAVIRPEYRALVWLAAGTGLRVGECAGLTWDRVDLAAGTVTVDRQLGRNGLAPPKTKTSRRTVPLPATVARELQAHKLRHGVTTVIVTGVDGHPVEVAPVFRSPRGDVMTRDGVRHYFTQARTRAKLPKAVTFHRLRHTYASMLIDAGENPRVIQERMGHASITVTMDVYGHLFPHADDRTRTIIDGAFGNDIDSQHRTDGPDATGIAA